MERLPGRSPTPLDVLAQRAASLLATDEYEMATTRSPNSMPEEGTPFHTTTTSSSEPQQNPVGGTRRPIVGWHIVVKCAHSLVEPTRATIVWISYKMVGQAAGGHMLQELATAIYQYARGLPYRLLPPLSEAEPTPVPSEPSSGAW